MWCDKFSSNRGKLSQVTFPYKVVIITIVLRLNKIRYFSIVARGLLKTLAFLNIECKKKLKSWNKMCDNYLRSTQIKFSTSFYNCFRWLFQDKDHYYNYTSMIFLIWIINIYNTGRHSLINLMSCLIYFDPNLYWNNFIDNNFVTKRWCFAHPESFYDFIWTF